EAGAVARAAGVVLLQQLVQRVPEVHLEDADIRELIVVDLVYEGVVLVRRVRRLDAEVRHQLAADEFRGRTGRRDDADRRDVRLVQRARLARGVPEFLRLGRVILVRVELAHLLVAVGPLAEAGRHGTDERAVALLDLVDDGLPVEGLRDRRPRTD